MSYTERDSTADTTEASQSNQKETEPDPKDKGKGSLLKSVNPFSKSKKEDEEPSSKSEPQQATTGTSQEEEKNLPPNHLGVNVPSGASTDFAPPGTPGEGASPKATKTMSQEQNESVKNASAEGVDEGKFGQAGLLNPDQNRSGSSSGQQSGGPSPAQLRGSRASIAAPTKERVFNPHATNPGRIPTAGGVAVGSKQFEQRRASRVSASELPPKKSSMDQEGSPDTTTQTNTATNTVPQGPSSPSIPEGDESGGPRDTSAMGDEAGGPRDTSAAMGDEAGGPKDTSAANGATSTGTEDKSKVEQMKEKAKENVPSSSGGGSSGDASKERRGSSFERFKSKLTGKK